MRTLKISVAQFQPKDREKEYNLSVITNQIGYDRDQLKNGNSLIVDPYGYVLVEIKSFDDEKGTAIIIENKLILSGGWRYRNARKPELYKDNIGAEHESKTKPVWMEK